MRAQSPPVANDRRDASVLPKGKCCRIFCGVPPGVPEPWFFFTPSRKGKCCPIFCGAFPGSGRELLGVSLSD